MDKDLRDALALLITGLKDNKESLIATIKEGKDNDKDKRMQKTVSKIDELGNKVTVGLATIVEAVNSQEQPEAVNLDAITKGLDSVVEAVKSFDKEVIVNTEEKIIDNTDVIEAMNAVRDSIDMLDLAVDVEAPEINFDTKGIEKLLTEIKEKELFIPPVISVDLDPNLIESDRVRVTLSEKQLAKIGGSSMSATNGVNKSVRITSIDGNDVRVNEDGQMHVVLEGHLCPCNSTTTPLLADAVFTGEAENILQYNGVSLFVTSDVGSADMGLEVQYSKDGLTNWRTAETYTVLAGAEKWFTPPAFGVYFRVVYTNGAIDQTSFELTTVFRKAPFKWSSHNIEVPIADQDDAELVKAVITGKKANGEYDNVSLTNGGNMKVSIEEFDPAVAITLTDFTDNLDGESVMQTAAVMFGRTNDDKVVPIKLDGSTQDTQVIEHEHAEIHSGDHYNYCDYSIDGLAAGVIIDFTFQTADTDKLVHLVIEAYSATGATIELYEGATGVSGGTAIIPRNNDRSSVNTSGVILLQDPTIVSDGTRAAGFLAGAGRKAGFFDRSKENILARNTTYILRITSTAAQNRLSWCAEWYEHTSKN